MKHTYVDTFVNEKDFPVYNGYHNNGLHMHIVRHIATSILAFLRRNVQEITRGVHIIGTCKKSVPTVLLIFRSYILNNKGVLVFQHRVGDHIRGLSLC